MTTCESTTCDSAADVTIEQVNDPGTCVCWRQLVRRLLAGSHEIRGFRRLDWEPKYKDDLPLPACKRHFDDLNWPELPGTLMADEPGWSRG